VWKTLRSSAVISSHQPISPNTPSTSLIVEISFG
jgi:hypothetical protein